ncbi:MAG TPA: HigA family addiction module antitoxin [Candidatus Binataceae bacterium]|nr:HigA family addiction module antitoxin [Candidatus Binataceae bacterium]
MIKTFRSRGPELLSARKSPALFHPIELAQGVDLVALRKLAQLNAAEEIRDLAVPEENCLNPATHENGMYTVRISHAWQLNFVWRDRDAYDVDLVRAYALRNLQLAKRQADLLPPIHPGEILHHDFTRPHSINVNEIARALGAPPAKIRAVIYGELSVTVDVAVGLGTFFDTTADLWMNLQRDYDLQVAESAKLAAIN